MTKPMTDERLATCEEIAQVGLYDQIVRLKGQITVQATIQTIRRRFGRDIILAAPNGTRAGYYLPRDWKTR